MCGIVAIFGTGTGVQDELARMLASVRTRGETDEQFAGPDFCVATRRLKIVDRERAIQPIWNEDRNKLIIFSGEIFNYKALKQDLETRHHFATNSDTETILHAYEEYGPRCVEHLDGQFAFVIYDLQTRALFAARDHLGVVPLYFVAAEEVLYIASLIQTLTFLGKKIQALPPGHTLDGQGNLRAYYRPRYGRCTSLSRSEFAATLKSALQRAVAKRLDTDLPIGVIYSGGIDSSVVLSEALKQHGDVTAFTIGTPRSEDFEVSQRFCRENRIRQVVIPLQRRDIDRAAIRRTIGATELTEYLDIINAVVSMPLFARIHQQEIKVVLGGDGSDELFAGYEMYRHVSGEDEARLFVHNLLALHRTELQRVDRCSMAHEVEVRVPFLDMEVVDLALQMPMAWKVHDGMEKWAVREAFRDELPGYIVNRTKNPLSYSSGLHEWVRMYKPFFAAYYHEFAYDLHAPIKIDFSYTLTRNGFDLSKAIQEDEKGRDYPRSELLKEAIKAGVRTYLLRG